MNFIIGVRDIALTAGSPITIGFTPADAGQDTLTNSQIYATDAPDQRTRDKNLWSLTGRASAAILEESSKK